MIFNLFRKDRRHELIAFVYASVAAASREPALYEELEVPDTLEGRFESLALHMVLALRALRPLPPPADEIARDLTDALFADLDGSMREMGVGDTVVPKRMKTLAQAFYGRAAAYEAALAERDLSALTEAIARNVYAGERAGDALADYAMRADGALRGIALDHILKDGLVYPAPGRLAQEG